jgi:aminoglycoside N3'-acetyltransferase
LHLEKILLIPASRCLSFAIIVFIRSERWNTLKTTITYEDIVNALGKLGLHKGLIVEVHSSLSKVGFVEGGAVTVINALMDVIGITGTIVMSAYRVSLPLPLTEEEKAIGLTAKVRILDEDTDCNSGMGIVSDTFRHWPGTVMGKGINRVCAWGKDAVLLSEGYDQLIKADGCVLLMGVDINRCSSMHTAENKVKLPDQLKALHDLPEEIRKMYPENNWYVEYSDPQKQAHHHGWDKVWQEAKKRNLFKQGVIGNATSYFFRAKPVVDIYEFMLKTDPYALLDVNKVTD